MQELPTSDCLSFGDALFLHLERPEAPLHVASLCIFEGEVTLEECTAHIDSKLPLIPRYTQRVAPTPFGLGMPMWQYDPNFAIGNHVRELKLKRGTEHELRKTVSEILSHPLDRQRPLWDFALITGLQDKRTAVLARIHHCLADGIAGVALLNVMMDTDPSAPIKSTKPTPKPQIPPQDPATQVMNSLVTSWFSTLDRVLKAESQLLRMAQDLVANSARVTNPQNALPDSIPPDLASLLPEFASPTDRLPFNVVCHGPQTFEWAEIPFADIHAIKRAGDATVNDVILTLIAMTIRRYALTKGLACDRKVLRIVVPVNVRSQEDTGGLGNQITFVPVTVPLGIDNPLKLLAAVHARTTVIKRVRLAEMVGLAGTVLGTIPTAFQMFAGPIASQLPLPICNLICTNVPGPQQRLYLLGHEMLTCYPYVPIGGEMGMNCAIITYNGKAFVGFTGDMKAIPDLRLLPKFLNQSFHELSKSLKPPKAPKPKTRPKRRAARGEIEQTTVQETTSNAIPDKATEVAEPEFTQAAVAD